MHARVNVKSRQAVRLGCTDRNIPSFRPIPDIGYPDIQDRNMSTDSAGEMATSSTGSAAETSPAELQQRYRQFLELLPLTLALAGLPTSEGRLYSEDQIEGRAMTIRTAFRVARSTVRDALGGS